MPTLKLSSYQSYQRRTLQIAIITFNEVKVNTPEMNEIKKISVEKYITKNNKMESFRIETYNNGNKIFTG